MYCKNCGVELEEDMLVCPLCGKPVHDQDAESAVDDKPASYLKASLNRTQRRFTWEIISIILGSGIVAALIVNLIISKKITWSEYTTASGLVIFCYVSIFAFWTKNKLAGIASAFILASGGLLLLDVITGGVSWADRLAIPLLLGVNVIGLIYMKVVQSARYKGINLIAYAFMGAALLCISAEWIISFFMWGTWRLNWSVIVAACVVPVVVILLFIHFRLKKGQDLKRTFHV
ncbi:DUF6320 domain-containing protein [Chitinophaga sp. XS-30]|uniref:DUF6320 domain-containing protein n=1 Tax=Chitinophaga sp. XS-30 TaxID=2604421 RepID=UPI0011DE3013|nr:DUF6320 domain-containing protein [Chitinophaga sp. XS-30]QEH41653.1 zinc ribbon domain-containing protein [Chitinophaga sp. XS-30]